MYGLGGQCISLLLSFANRSVFIYSLGVTYLGINGLFSNVLSLLSFAELGIGFAITFSLYKPLHQNNREQIKSLMRLYGRAYRLIGCFIGIVGLALTPFLDFIIKNRPHIANIQIYYLLMLSGTVASYFFTYKRSLILSDQKGYLNTKNIYKFAILQSCVQMAVLLFLKNYILYLVVGTLMLVASNISISRKANSLYPYLKEKKIKPLEKAIKNTILKNTTAMVFHKIGGAIISASDNIILSTFVGLESVGIYSNYFIILNTVQNFITQIFSSMQSSVANLIVADEKRSYDLFVKINFSNFLINCFSTTCIFVLINPFILVWLHSSKFLFNGSILLFLTINFYQINFHQTPGMFINSAGLFWNNKFKPIFECSIKLFASILLVNKLGIVGVFIGTMCSFTLTSFWVEAYILYKHIFHHSFFNYLVQYVIYAGVACFTIAATTIVCRFTPNGSIPLFLLKTAECALVSSGILFLFYFKTKRFQECLAMLRPVIRKIRKH